MLPVIGGAEEWTVICRISVKSFMFPLLLLQVLSIAVQVKVAPRSFGPSLGQPVRVRLSPLVVPAGIGIGLRSAFHFFLPSFPLSLSSLIFSPVVVTRLRGATAPDATRRAARTTEGAGREDDDRLSAVAPRPRTTNAPNPRKHSNGCQGSRNPYICSIILRLVVSHWVIIFHTLDTN